MHEATIPELFASGLIQPATRQVSKGGAMTMLAAINEKRAAKGLPPV